MVSTRSFMTVTTTLTILSISVIRRQSETHISSFTAGVVLLNIVLIWCYHAYIYPYFFSKLKDIPVAPDYHWLGAHTFTTAATGPFTCTPFRKWVEQADTDLIRYFDARHVEYVIAVSDSALQELFTTKCYHFGKSSAVKRGANLTVLGDGLIIAEGDAHKQQRKQMNPAFSFRHIKNLVPQFWSISMHLFRAVEGQRDAKTGKAVIEPNDWTSRATLDIIGQAGLGVTFDAIEMPDSGLANAYNSLFALDGEYGFLLRVVEFVIPAWFLQALPLAPMRRFVSNITAIRRACRAIILEKQAMKRKTADMLPMDILSAILSESVVSFTNEQIEEHLLTFLAAGHETTGSAMAWALLALCTYPEVQKKLREELWTNLHASIWKQQADTGVTADQLASMPYLQAFCNEVLRVWPPVPATTRVALVDTSLAGHTIPKGTPVVVSIWGTNVSTALWGPDAAHFRPERWLESSSGGCKSHYAFQTFISGPRNCIGMSFAKHEFLCLLAAWVGRFETRFAPGQGGLGPPHVLGGISAKPTPGWKIEVEVIEQA